MKFREKRSIFDAMFTLSGRTCIGEDDNDMSTGCHHIIHSQGQKNLQKKEYE